MTDEERQRTMDFILKQQVVFAAGMQRLEEADARASVRMDRLERMLLLMARRFRRERDELRERTNALIESQMATEEAVRRTEKAVRSLTAATERNTEDLTALSEKVEGEDGDAGKDGATES